MNIGDKIIIIAERNIFNFKKLPSDLSLQAFAESALTGMVNNTKEGLHIVQIEIIETKKVKGDYRPEEEHDGYRALGSDGWHYHCQWNSFDDCSPNPYTNWQREFIEGTHYTTHREEDGRNHIDKWLIDQIEFQGHYMNWTAKSVMRFFHEAVQKAVAAYIAEKWPEHEMFICQNSHTSRGDGALHNHAVYGWAHKNEGCFMCKFIAREKTEETTA